MNRAKLTPYPMKPTNPANSEAERLGNVPPAQRPRARLTGPAMTPFNSTICSGSDNDTFRVKLLSSAQAAQAPQTARGPSKDANDGVPDHARIPAPATMHNIPIAMRRSKFS